MALIKGFTKNIFGTSRCKALFFDARESGELCLMAGLFGENRIFFPKLKPRLKFTALFGNSNRYLESKG